MSCFHCRICKQGVVCGLLVRCCFDITLPCVIDILNFFIIRDFFYSYEDTAWRKLDPSKRKMCRKYNITLGKRQHVTRYLIFTVLVKVQYITQFITWICVITLLRMTFTALKCNIWAASANPKLVNLSIIRSYWRIGLNMNIILKYIAPCV